MSTPDAVFALQPPPAIRSSLAPWHLALHRAASRAEVMEIANEFVRQWSDEELAELPDGCRPWKEIVEAAEIHFLKHLLAFHDLQHEQGWPLLHSMCLFFRGASLRVLQLPVGARGEGEA